MDLKVIIEQLGIDSKAFNQWKSSNLGKNDDKLDLQEVQSPDIVGDESDRKSSPIVS